MGLVQVIVRRLRRYIKRNFKYHTYPSRVLIVVVWCAVVWALLGDDSLPITMEDADSVGCMQYAQNVSSNRSATSNLLQSEILSNLDDSFLLRFYSPFAIFSKNDTWYEVLLLRKHTYCSQGNVRTVTLFVDSVGLSENGTAADPELFNISFQVVNLPENEPPNTLIYIPDGHFFALTVLLILSSIFGVFMKVFCLPPLLGMIIAGFLLRNLPNDVISDINPVWSSTIRNIALVIVLIRGGLSLNLEQLKRLKRAFVLLALVPCLLEGALDGVVATFYLQLPWQWGFMLG